MTTNVPQIQFLDQGPSAPPEGAYVNGVATPGSILAGILADWTAAFASVNGSMNVSPATPQGQLASSTAAMIGNQNNAIILFCNLIDPNLTFGRFQDAIARIYFLSRYPGTPTSVTCTVTGAGATIPVNAQVMDQAGNIYLATQALTFPVGGGSYSLVFNAMLPGPIGCPAGTLTEIYVAIPGWDAITNPAPGIPGTNTETAQQFELRRQQSVAHNSIGSLPAILGAVLAVAGVTDAFVTDNSSNSSVTVNNYELLPNSLYVAAVGGADLDIATAIWQTKGPGAAYNGNTTEIVYDTSSQYSSPYPAYSITFERPVPLTVLFVVLIQNSAQVPSNATTLIQNAILNAFAGLDGGAPAKIATEVFASRYYAPVALLGSWAQIVDILVGSQNNPDCTVAGSISGTTLMVSSVVSGAVAVGQTLFDLLGLMLPNTVITALGSGTGGIGTYTINQSQNLSATQIYGVTGDQYTVQPNLNEIPVTSAVNIQVMLT